MQSRSSSTLKSVAWDGMRWTAAASSARMLLQFGLVVTLARLLTPEDFGVMSACLVVATLVQTVTVTTVGPVLVQRPALSRDDIRTAFTLSNILAVAVAVAAFLNAHFLATVIRIEAVESAMRVMSAAFLLGGVSLVAEHLLQREMRLRHLSLIELAAYAANGVVAVLLAYQGAGYWALVWGYMIQIGTRSIILLAMKPRSLSFGWSKESFLAISNLGVGFALARFFNFIGGQADNLIVGRNLGAEALGFYGRAYQLMTFPANIYATVADRVMFPYMSRIREQPGSFAESHLAAIRASAAIGLPLTVILVIGAPTIVDVLLGSQWDNVVLPFAILALVVYFRVSQKISATVLRASGSTYKHALLQGLYAVTVIIGASVGSRTGLAGVAIGVSAAVLLHSTLLALASTSASGASKRCVLLAHKQGFAHAALTLCICWTLSSAFSELHGLVELGAMAVASIAGAVVAMRIFPSVFSDASWPFVGRKAAGINPEDGNQPLAQPRAQSDQSA